MRRRRRGAHHRQERQDKEPLQPHLQPDVQPVRLHQEAHHGFPLNAELQ